MQDRQGRARTCLGQDGQGQFMGRMDKGLDGLDVKKAWMPTHPG